MRLSRPQDGWSEAPHRRVFQSPALGTIDNDAVHLVGLKQRLARLNKFPKYLLFPQNGGAARSAGGTVAKPPETARLFRGCESIHKNVGSIIFAKSYLTVLVQKRFSGHPGGVNFSELVFYRILSQPLHGRDCESEVQLRVRFGALLNSSCGLHSIQLPTPVALHEILIEISMEKDSRSLKSL